MPRFIAIFCLATALAGCDVKVGENGLSFDISEGKASDEWKRSYTLAAGGTLEIVNTFGRIDAIAGDGPAVEVVAMREVRSGSPEQAKAGLAKIEMIEAVAPDRVRIETPSRELRGADPALEGLRLLVNYRVSIPAGLNVSLKSDNGHVHVENLKGTLTISSTNGGVTARGLSGPVDVQTVNGGVTVDMASLGGDVNVGGVNGGIRIAVASTVDANLELHAVNGGVSVDEALPLTASQRERQHIVGRINKGGRKISAQIVNGGVRIAASSPDSSAEQR
jgi:hypothetical protein